MQIEEAMTCNGDAIMFESLIYGDGEPQFIPGHFTHPHATESLPILWWRIIGNISAGFSHLGAACDEHGDADARQDATKFTVRPEVVISPRGSWRGRLGDEDARSKRRFVSERDAAPGLQTRLPDRAARPASRSARA